MNYSPNKTKGRYGQKPEAVIIHTTDGPFQGSKAWVLNESSRVSYHFIISENGEICQLVDTQDTAWHAGVVKEPTWKLLKPNINPNTYTIGVAFAGYAKQKPTIIQIISTIFCVKAICNKYKIQIDEDHIIPHYMIRADKSCPGPQISVKSLIWMIDKI